MENEDAFLSLPGFIRCTLCSQRLACRAMTNPPVRVTGESLVPQAISLPGDKAVFTDVKEIGPLRLKATVSKKAKPLQSGFSIGHPNITAGTLGAIVKRAGKLYVLSNSHVLAEGGLAKVGDSIVYPGATDGGNLPANLAASLSAFVPFDTSGGWSVVWMPLSLRSKPIASAH